MLRILLTVLMVSTLSGCYSWMRSYEEPLEGERARVQVDIAVNEGAARVYAQTDFCKRAHEAIVANTTFVEAQGYTGRAIGMKESSFGASAKKRLQAEFYVSANEVLPIVLRGQTAAGYNRIGVCTVYMYFIPQAGKDYLVAGESKSSSCRAVILEIADGKYVPVETVLRSYDDAKKTWCDK